MSDEVKQPSSGQTEKKNKSGSVVGYLVILFIAAFLLLLMAYFMQQRAADAETIDTLRQSITSIESLDDLIEENQALRAENETLLAQLEDLADRLTLLENERSTLNEEYARKTEQADLLKLFCEVSALIQQADYEGAQARLSDWNPDDLAAAIASYDDEMSPNNNGEPVLAPIYESYLQILEENLGSED